MGEAFGGDGVILRSLVTLLTLVTLFAGGGCHRHAASASADGGDDSAPVALKEDTTGLLLTWIDDKGDFHVEQRVADVPIVGRDAVRVVDPTRDDGTHPDRIFVADLRMASSDGSYPVRVSTRAEFEGLAEGRREKNGPTLAAATGAADAGSGGLPSAPQMQLAPNSGQPGTAPDPTGAPRPVVIIYGASWCGPCHQAAAYLRQKGVPFVEKDIEEDANAAREMRAKLARAGMHPGSIPVLDVRGKLMVGFNPHEVDEALGEAL
jgi:glutaredoxin